MPHLTTARSAISILAFGINHRTAPIQIRERVAFNPATLEQALRDLVTCPAVLEGAILSTCNRTELYCTLPATPSPEIAEKTLMRWLSHYHQLPPDHLKPYSYTYPNQAAIRHCLRVASGLDSMILGEPQILGQMKTAYHQAQAAGTLGTFLNRLFQHTFTVAKQVRTDTAIGSSPVSVAFAAIDLAKQIFSHLHHKTALLVGAGETIELVARHLYENQIGRLMIANRTLAKAHQLASTLNGFALELSEIPAHLPEADLVITSTASPLPLLGKGMVESAFKKRKRKPVLMVDLAVPRDIEPEVGQLADVYLYTVDDLQAIIQENLQSRQEAAQQAEEIITVEVEHFMGWLRSLSAVDTIRDYRSQAQQIRDELLTHALQALDRGQNPQQVVQRLAEMLTNKLLHHPCVTLKQAGMDERTDLIQAARELFNLHHQNKIN